MANCRAYFWYTKYYAYLQSSDIVYSALGAAPKVTVRPTPSWADEMQREDELRSCADLNTEGTVINIYICLFLEIIKKYFLTFI